MNITPAERGDLRAILDLQYLAYQSEAQLLNDFSIPPLRQRLEDVEKEFVEGLVLKAVSEQGEIIGSVRGRSENGTLYVGKLMVRPDHQGKGLGTRLLAAIEKCLPHSRYELFTSDRSAANLRLYEKAGYTRFAEKRIKAGLTFIYLEKRSLP